MPNIRIEKGISVWHNNPRCSGSCCDLWQTSVKRICTCIQTRTYGLQPCAAKSKDINSCIFLNVVFKRIRRFEYHQMTPSSQSHPKPLHPLQSLIKRRTNYAGHLVPPPTPPPPPLNGLYLISYIHPSSLICPSSEACISDSSQTGL